MYKGDIAVKYHGNDVPYVLYDKQCVVTGVLRLARTLTIKILIIGIKSVYIYIYIYEYTVKPV